MQRLLTLAKYAGLLLLTLLVLAVLMLGVLAGLLGSPGGTRFLAGQLRPVLGDQVRWASLEGSLTGPLTITGLAVATPGVEFELERLELDWSPRALLQRQLRVTRLRAERGELRLSASEEKPASEPFDPATLRSPLVIDIQGVAIRDLAILQDGAPLQSITALDAELGFVGDALTLPRLTLRVPEGGVALSVNTRLRTAMPLDLDARWDWLLPAPVDADGVVVGAPVPLAGTLGLNGEVDWSTGIAAALDVRAGVEGADALVPELPGKLELEGRIDARLVDTTATLDTLSLALVGTPLALNLSGSVSALDADPVAELSLAWQGLQWPLAVDAPMVMSERGALDVSGNAAAYALTLNTDVAGADIPPGQWQLRGRGDLTALVVEELRGQVLGGSLLARGPVSWDPQPRWQINVRGEALDPALIAPDLSGELNFALDSAGQLDAEAGMTAGIVLRDFQGTLMQRPLTASARARVVGETLTLDALSLASEGNAVTAAGTASADSLALDWTLTAGNPAALAPGAHGRLSAQGRLSGSPDIPSLEARFSGDGLGLDALTLATLTGDVRANLDPEAPLTLTLVLGEVTDGEQVVLTDAGVEVSGSLARHRFALAGTTASERVDLELDGGLDDELDRWSGQLARLSLGSDSFGDWHLQAPAALSLSADRVALAISCLARDDAPGAVCIEASRDGTGDSAGDSALAATLTDLPVAIAVPTMTGALAGDFTASLGANGALLAKGDVRLSPGDVVVPTPTGDERLPHGGGRVDLVVDAAGLAAAVDFAAPEEGVVHADLRMPALTTVPPAGVQPLSGAVRATLPRLDTLAAWVPELETVGGRLDADIDLGGTLERPDLRGAVTLADGRADVPMAGLALRDIGFRAASNPDNPAQLDLSGGLRSGSGQLTLLGQADIASASFTMDIRGEGLEVYNTPDARVQLSPDLTVGLSDDTLRLRGDLVIPDAAITPRLLVRPATASAEAQVDDTPGQVLAPSPDVVIINGPEVDAATVLPVSAPFRIDSQVRVALGQRVRVDAVGFKSRLEGAVTFINRPEETDLIPLARGRYDIRDGTFRAFGQDLEIETGQVIFAGVPATEPELNVRAVRWIDNDPEVTAAGVLVTGPATQPVLELFSRPQLEPSEIQSYLLTGTSASDRSNVLAIGTYLTPRFYVGYGYNLLEGTSEFNSLFDITPRYGVSANAGEADSNVNLTVTYEH